MAEGDSGLDGGPALNTDRELWREPTDRVGQEFYQPSIHVTEGGGIGINVGGMVYVRPLREWHAAMVELESLRASLTRVEEERDEVRGYLVRNVLEPAGAEPLPTLIGICTQVDHICATGGVKPSRLSRPVVSEGKDG